jgi:HTTM domain
LAGALLGRVGAWARARWTTVDLRTLGLFRIYFGLLLLANLAERTQGLDLVTFYTNQGLWPNYEAIAQPIATDYWSLLLTFSTPGEVRVVFLAIAVVYALYTVGYGTRFLKWATIPLIVSVNNRNLLPQHAGDVVVNLVAVWTAFLPVGARFSVDSLLRSLRAVDERSASELDARTHRTLLPSSVSSFAYFAVCLNFAVIYFLNALHKQGPSWHGGSAVHWVLWQNRIATSLAAFVRAHEPGFLSPLLTWQTLVFEWCLPVLILLPVFQRYTRGVAFACIWILHGGIASLLTLGPFSYGMMAFGLLLIQSEHWVWLEKKVRARHGRWYVPLDLRRPAQLGLARVLARLDVLGLLRFSPTSLWNRWESARQGAETGRPPPPVMRPAALGDPLSAVLLVCVLSQVFTENWGIPERWRLKNRPQWMGDVVLYPDIPQGWHMFSPDAPHDDEKLVVDAVLADRSHVDLLTGEPPDYDSILHGPFFYDQAWGEIHARMPEWPARWASFKAYLARRPTLLGWPPEKRVVSFSVYEVTCKSPPFGGSGPYDPQKKLLFNGP